MPVYIYMCTPYIVFPVELDSSSNLVAVQSWPYMRADVFMMADMPVPKAQMGVVRQRLEELSGIMRDIQNLASKYRSSETASIQQAMFWWV